MWNCSTLDSKEKELFETSAGSKRLTSRIVHPWIENMSLKLYSWRWEIHSMSLSVSSKWLARKRIRNLSLKILTQKTLKNTGKCFLIQILEFGWSGTISGWRKSEPARFRFSSSDSKTCFNNQNWYWKIYSNLFWPRRILMEQLSKKELKKQYQKVRIIYINQDQLVRASTSMPTKSLRRRCQS